jgi:hypothetical protein
MIGVFSCLFLILALGYVVYAVIMVLRYSLAIPAAVVEDIKARPAIRRSIELSKGSRGRIFLLMLLIIAVEMGLLFITQIFFVFAVMAAIKNHGEVPVWIQISQQIVGFLTNSFIGPIYATGITLFYYDQRIRKEGFDIEWMMEGAGMTASPPYQLLPASVPVSAEPTLEAAQPDAEAPSGPVEVADPPPPADLPPPEYLPPENPHG